MDTPQTTAGNINNPSFAWTLASDRAHADACAGVGAGVAVAVTVGVGVGMGSNTSLRGNNPVRVLSAVRDQPRCIPCPSTRASYSDRTTMDVADTDIDTAAPVPVPVPGRAPGPVHRPRMLEEDDSARDGFPECYPCDPDIRALLDTSTVSDHMLRVLQELTTTVYDGTRGASVDAHGTPLAHCRQLVMAAPTPAPAPTRMRAHAPTHTQTPREQPRYPPSSTTRPPPPLRPAFTASDRSKPRPPSLSSPLSPSPAPVPAPSPVSASAPRPPPGSQPLRGQALFLSDLRRALLHEADVTNTVHWNIVYILWREGLLPIDAEDGFMGLRSKWKFAGVSFIDAIHFAYVCNAIAGAWLARGQPGHAARATPCLNGNPSKAFAKHLWIQDYLPTGPAGCESCGQLNSHFRHDCELHADCGGGIHRCRQVVVGMHPYTLDGPLNNCPAGDASLAKALQIMARVAARSRDVKIAPVLWTGAIPMSFLAAVPSNSDDENAPNPDSVKGATAVAVAVPMLASGATSVAEKQGGGGRDTNVSTAVPPPTRINATTRTSTDNKGNTTSRVASIFFRQHRGMQTPLVHELPWPLDMVEGLLAEAAKVAQANGQEVPRDHGNTPQERASRAGTGPAAVQTPAPAPAQAQAPRPQPTKKTAKRALAPLPRGFTSVTTLWKRKRPGVSTTNQPDGDQAIDSTTPDVPCLSTHAAEPFAVTIQ